MRLKLSVIKADKEFPVPAQTRIESNHIIDDCFIGGKQYSYSDLECLVVHKPTTSGGGPG